MVCKIIKIFIFINFIFTYKTFAREYSIGCNCLPIFIYVKQLLFSKDINYENNNKKTKNNNEKIKVKILRIIEILPLWHRMFLTYNLSEHDFNRTFSHDFRYHFSFDIKEYIVNINISKLFEEENYSFYDQNKNLKKTNKFSIFSSCWINVTLFNIIFRSKKNKLNFFCYGVGLNFSKNSIMFSNENILEKMKNKEEIKDEYFKKSINYHCWGNFSICGTCKTFYKFSISTEISVNFFILKIPFISSKDEEDGCSEEKTDIKENGVLGYNRRIDKRFVVFNSKPVLSFFVNYNFNFTDEKKIDDNIYFN